MQVAIVGSRDSRKLTVDDLIQMIPLNCTRLISGGAEGVDQLARQPQFSFFPVFFLDADSM